MDIWIIWMRSMKAGTGGCQVSAMLFYSENFVYHHVVLLYNVKKKQIQEEHV